MDDLKSLAEMAVDYLNLLVDTTKELADAQRKTSEEVKASSEAIEKNTEATVNSTKAKNKEKDNIDKVNNSLKSLGKELLNITTAGIKFASTVGTSATQGVQLELRNRLAVAGQLLKFNADLAVTMEQQKAAQQGLTDAFISIREGSQLSSKGSIEFVQSLKKGFKSEFEPTAETFRILTQMGMSTTSQFDAFRRATGRASLSNNQLATLYNKNTLSFLLYGNSFARAAVNAERLGVNLASVQAAQEGLVTNLDGTIDTVAQLNQLGAQVDFGNLVRIAETEGPAALMAYVRATVPEQLMQSASTRALFKQLGISVEDYIKSGSNQISAADQLERQMTEAASQTKNTAGFLSTFGARVGKTSMILMGSFGALALSAMIAAKTLFNLGGIGTLLPGLSKGISGLLSYTSTALLIAPVISAIAAGIGIVGGGIIGKSLGGSTAGSFGGSVIGTILGGLVGSIIAPGAGTYIGMGLGGMVGGGVGGMITKANDMYSSGYGSRTLVTPSGAFALNNADDIIAGTNLFPKGSLRAGGDNSDLVREIKNLIGIITNASTVINVGGVTQTVPRMTIGAFTRNER